MRHGKKFNHLGRTKPHREAMLANMASSLVKHKKINTTLAKAKALRGFIEPLITKAKSDTTHSRRTVFKQLKDKYAVTELFRDVAPKIADRPGGYTRILKTGRRLGDNAEMCFIELVDFNEIRTSEQKATTETKKRTRRGRKKADGDTAKPLEAKTDKSSVAEAKDEANAKGEAPAEEESIVKDAEIVEEIVEETTAVVQEDESSDETSEGSTKEKAVAKDEEPVAEESQAAEDKASTDTEPETEVAEESKAETETETTEADPEATTEETKTEEVDVPTEEETKEEGASDESEEEADETKKEE